MQDNLCEVRFLQLETLQLFQKRKAISFFRCVFGQISIFTVGHPHRRLQTCLWCRTGCKWFHKEAPLFLGYSAAGSPIILNMNRAVFLGTAASVNNRSPLVALREARGHFLTERCAERGGRYPPSRKRVFFFLNDSVLCEGSASPTKNGQPKQALGTN